MYKNAEDASKRKSILVRPKPQAQYQYKSGSTSSGSIRVSDVKSSETEPKKAALLRNISLNLG